MINIVFLRYSQVGMQRIAVRPIFSNINSMNYSEDASIDRLSTLFLLNLVFTLKQKNASKNGKGAQEKREGKGKARW